MKRSDFYIKLTTGVLFVAVVCFIGASVIDAMMNPYETTTAIRYTVEQTFPAQGYIVRTESVLPQSDRMILPIVGEGEKVALGQAVAVEYLSSGAIEIASEIRELRLLIAQLEKTSALGSSEAARLETVMELSKAVQRSDLRRLDELSLNIYTSIFASDSELTSDLPTLKTRLETLEASATGSRQIYAPVSGTYSQIVDGYEHINPERLFYISPAELSALFSVPSGNHSSGAGKLITEFKWYYAALMETTDASRLSEGQSIVVQFSGAYHALVEMQVENIGSREGETIVVIFSSSRSIHEVAPLRELRADIVFGVVSGIRVPKEALMLDDDGTEHIYIQTGVRAERVDVERFRDVEIGDSYLVRDGAESGSPLRAGSTIIVKANNLFDGKIVG